MTKRDKKYNKALNYFNIKNFEKAMEICSQLIEEDQNDFQTYFLLANIFVALDDFKTAEEFLYISLKINENNFYPYNLLSTIYNKQERYDLALEIMDLIIEKFSKKKSYAYEIAATYTNMAIIQNKLENFELGIEYCEKALAIDPSYTDSYLHLARAYWRMGAISESAKYTKIYIDKNPTNLEIAFSYATLLLINEEYAEGFSYYENRLLKNTATSHDKIPYDFYKKGTSLDEKKLLIYSEQGLGDNLQFVRYFKELEKNENIVFLTEASLKKLFQYNFKDINIVDSIDTLTTSFDYKLPLLSIPYAFDKCFVDSKPYLTVPDDEVDKFKNQHITSGKKNIGIVWSTNQVSDYNSKRVLKLSDFSSLFENNDLQFYSLQVGETEELEYFENVVDLGKDFKDFYDTSVAIKSLDFVITIDTSVAHLVGALGQRGIVLHHNDIIDFRWNKVSGKSVWYESLEIVKFSNIEDTISAISGKIKTL